MIPKLSRFIAILCVLGAAVAHIHAQPTAPNRFQQLDSNDDGKPAQDKFPHPFFFKKQDKDGDGMLSREETAEIKAADGKNTATTTPPTAAPDAASAFKPRPHGDEAEKAGLWKTTKTR